MASDKIVDIASLLQPISDDNPAGSNIRDDSSPTSIYYTIKDSRTSARAAERSNMFDGVSTEADEHWRKILKIAPDILKNHAKDLEIASWYVEALIRKHGFCGLRDGFTLIHQLIEQYWADLFPLPDEDGIETRVAPLTGLNGEGAEGVLIAPIRNVNITEGREPGPFNYWKYSQAVELQKISDLETREEKVAKAGFSIDHIEAAVTESSTDFYLNLRDDLTVCISEYREISRLLDEHCGTHEAPPTSNIINTLQDCLGTINHIGKNKMPAELTESTESDTESEKSQSVNADTTVSDAIANRDEAFRQLTQISEFFRKTEPHSPISYILEKAVKWGDMSLSELMKELIPDSSSREYYGSLTGIKTEDEY